jgi:hypothetical protein
MTSRRDESERLLRSSLSLAAIKQKVCTAARDRDSAHSCRLENIQKGCRESRIALFDLREREARCLYVFDNSSGLFSMHVLIQLSREITHASPPNYNIARRDLHRRVKSRSLASDENKKNCCCVCVYIMSLYSSVYLSWGCERGQSRLFLCATLAVFTPYSSSFSLFILRQATRKLQTDIYEST